MEIARHWRLKKQRYGLVGEQCPNCDEKIFPPRPVHNCPTDGNNDGQDGTNVIETVEARLIYSSQEMAANAAD